jgi:beta-ribofuranosylaminobenzene 5'-phosphate synthase
MIRVKTGSRLHFGLFRLPGRPSVAGVGTPTPPSTRHFGGVGLMIERPGLAVCAQPASSFSVSGCERQRAELLAAQAIQVCAIPQKYAVHVESCPAQHIGLGTGTQLSLAIALALTKAVAEVGATTPVKQDSDLLDLAVRLGRGRRSALGIHGFIHGGFLVEAGKGPETAAAPLVARASFPESWRILVLLPPGKPGLHGLGETKAFADLSQLDPPDRECDALCRLTLLGMLPAIHEADLPSFSAALHEFNRKVGEMFEPAQGGTYNNSLTRELIAFLRSLGVAGAGQSSWGPAVFAVTDADRAQSIAGLVRQRFGLGEHEAVITQARNRGVCWETTHLASREDSSSGA